MNSALQSQPTADEKYFKNTESSRKQNLNLLHAGNYLYNIFIVLGVISNLEIKYTGGYFKFTGGCV